MKKCYIFLTAILLTIVNIAIVYSQDNKDRENDTIHVVGHAHMDMNWLWTYSETMQMCNDNLRQTVAFMNEFPDYTMLQSQAAVYNFVEKADPPLFQLIQKYVKDGRLELAGGMWTEGDMNLSSGEAISRTFLLGQRYFLSRFGKMTNVGWLPDNFGHISQMPQILKLAGCDYFYFHRCKPYKGTFWWTGPDSSTVLCYANDTYNGEITLKLKDELGKITPGRHRLLQITGIGDHGGGPTRANIEMVHQLDKTPGYPAVKFTTAGEFFRKASKEMNGRPTYRGEMQFIFEGCYTTVADIKAGNRNCESLLYTGEFFNTLRWLHGDKYPADELRDLWTMVTFNQFHDILPGSGINEANKENIARYYEVLRKATELTNIAFRKNADEVKFQSGIGQPVVAYNLHPYSRPAIVEANVYSHNEPFTAILADWGDYYGSKNVRSEDRGQGNVPSVLVRDGSGKTYPAQIVWGKSTPPGYTSKVQFIVDDLPPGGYKTFYVDMTRPGEYNKQIMFKDNTFDTDFFTVKFNMKTGSIISLFDKRSNKEFVKEGGELNRLRIYLEDKKGEMKSWSINKIVREEDIGDVVSVKVVENGPVRACVESIKTWGKSRFVTRTYLYRSYPRIAYDLEVDWLETGSDSTDSPMLRAIFPLAFKNPEFNCNVPFDVVTRPVNGQEVPAQRWVDFSEQNAGIALLNRTKYGHSYNNGELRLTLLRSAGNPDLYPNLGKFYISYALYPHSGDWKNGVWAEGDDFNVPVFASEPPSLALVKDHATRPEEESFLSLDSPGVILSGLKMAEDGNELIVRLAEIEGKSTVVNLKLAFEINSVQRLNLIELVLENAAKPVINGRSIQLRFSPHEIVTLGITPARK
jgi:alpha-mannosidase